MSESSDSVLGETSPLPLLCRLAIAQARIVVCDRANTAGLDTVDQLRGESTVVTNAGSSPSADVVSGRMFAEPDDDFDDGDRRGNAMGRDDAMHDRLLLTMTAAKDGVRRE